VILLWITVALFIVYVGMLVGVFMDRSSTAWAGKIFNLKKKAEKLNKKIDKAYKKFELAEQIEAELKKKVR
jgi:hypothetical protein